MSVADAEAPSLPGGTAVARTDARVTVESVWSWTGFVLSRSDSAGRYLDCELLARWQR